MPRVSKNQTGELTAKQIADREYYQAHKDIIKARTKQWRLDNPDRRREQARRDAKVARKRDPEKYRARYRTWYYNNPEKQKQRTDEWNLKNPEKRKLTRRAAGRRYENRKRGATGSHSELEWYQLLSAHNGMCAYCTINLGVEREHVLPISRGGADSIDNILPSCRSCNGSKHVDTPEEWLDRKSRINV